MLYAVSLSWLRLLYVAVVVVAVVQRTGTLYVGDPIHSGRCICCAQVAQGRPRLLGRPMIYLSIYLSVPVAAASAASSARHLIDRHLSCSGMVMSSFNPRLSLEGRTPSACSRGVEAGQANEMMDCRSSRWLGSHLRRHPLRICMRSDSKARQRIR
ncbi:hypothetical protein B0T19DRAFT_216181 [Cercophora scortea]|uniref:Uncharacterized protein n=1 Tax=Cercophora scortea TaxID=314031 RepID=A0AAE0IEY9_9PEZI|nr:hypothetical protein B0T19DRAFT_216181 [Cercophora scortea]